MTRLTFDYQHSASFVSRNEIMLFEREVALHRKAIYNGQGAGSDFLGWTGLPHEAGSDLTDRLESDAKKIRAQSDVVVLVGIGGSYLGARAVIEALSGALPPKAGCSQGPLMLYAGHHLDEDYLGELLAFLDNKDYSLIVISKSGTTTEPAIAFRLLRQHLQGKYGEAASDRIFAVTDASKGALKTLAEKHSYATYVIPDDVGGRYSVLSPVGLLPIAVAGLPVRELLAGAAGMSDFLRREDSLMQNPASLYAVIRNILYNKGRTTEILAAYNPSLRYMIEWWKQLYGESEGKDGKGIFPAGAGFTTDLHSMGQYIQDGLRTIFETVIRVDQPSGKVVIPHDEDDQDGLNYITGKRLSHVNHMALKGTMMAHTEGGVPNLMINLPLINAHTLGELIYFFEMACAISGYILGINPFDQPGVEAYKKNMFALLEKPGFEDLTEKLKKKLR